MKNKKLRGFVRMRKLEIEEEKAFNELTDSFNMTQFRLMRAYMTARHKVDLQRLDNRE